MKILALDPATKCGVAYGDTTFWAPTTAMWDLSTRRDESTGMKLLRLESKLDEFLGRVDLLVYEAARNAAPKMQGALVHQAKLEAIIVRWCETHKIDYRGYSPSEIKKHASGKGNANKAAMIEAARTRYLYEGNDDNEADALCLAHLAASEYGRTA